MKKSLWCLLGLAVLNILFQLFLRPAIAQIPLLIQGISMLFLWSPGIVALAWARKEKISLPIFAKPNRTVYLIPAFAFIVAIGGFLLYVIFRGLPEVSPLIAGQTFWVKIGFGAILFVSNFVLMAVLLSFVFLGGELYWRGYLWEKMREKGAMRAMWTIFVLWTLWFLPFMFLSYVPVPGNWWTNLFYTVSMNAVYTPIVFYYRIKGRSIYPAALFSSTMFAAFIYFVLLFPITAMKEIGIYWGLTLIVLFIFSLLYKLYSSRHWEKLIRENQ